MRRILLVCAIALALPPAAGCGDKKPDCAGIAKRVAELATAELEQKGAAAGDDAKAKEWLELERKMIPVGEATTRERCAKEQWAGAKIDCVHRAKSMAEVRQCR